MTRPRLRRGDRRAVVAVIAVIVSVPVSALFAGSARADVDGLVAWAAANGFQGSPQAIGLHGSLVCADLAMGDNGEQTAQDLWRNTGIADINDARAFVIEAVDQLCREFDHRGQQAAPAPTSGSIGGAVKL